MTAIDFKREVAELRRLASDPMTVPELLLQRGEDLRGRLREHLGSLKGDASAFFKCAGEVDDDFRDLLGLEANTRASITLGAELDKLGSRAERRAALFSGGGAAPAAKRWLPTLSEYRRWEMEGKAASVGSDPSGGYLVPTTLGPLVDRLRPQSVVLAAGPRVINMTTQRHELPRLGTSATVSAVGETGPLTESSPQFEKVVLSAVDYLGYSAGSTDWFADANEDALLVLQQDQERQLGAKLDVEFLQGTGASASLIGMRNISGVVNTNVAADAGNGGLPALADVLDAIDRLQRNNATPSAVFMHPRTWATFRKLVDSQQRLQLTPNPADAAAKQLFGLPVYTSSQVSITETKGANSDCSYILVCDMTQVVVGMRQQASVLVDPYSASTSRQVRVITTVRAAFNLLTPNGVEVIRNVRTS